MRGLWMKVRIPLAVIFLLVITLAMVRLFSGPEDSWIQNDRGEWVRHGNPAGPPPAVDYREPLSGKIVPLVFLAAFALPVFFIGMHKPHNRLNFDKAARDIKFSGYLSTSLCLFGILVIAALLLELIKRGPSAIGNTELLVLGSLSGLAGVCILAGIQFFILKRNVNDHFQLEKNHREMMEALRNHSADK
jgi:hypothetical protein